MHILTVTGVLIMVAARIWLSALGVLMHRMSVTGVISEIVVESHALL